MDDMQMSRLAKLLEDSFKPYIKLLVDEAVKEIPYRIHQHIHDIEMQSIRAAIREKIEAGLYISFQLKETP